MARPFILVPASDFAFSKAGRRRDEARTIHGRADHRDFEGSGDCREARDGKRRRESIEPVGEIYVGATYVESGVNRDVAVSVQTAPEPQQGTLLLVMLHRDVNEDGSFDFVFVDERNVRDAAVFEGRKMIAHVIAAPQCPRPAGFRAAQLLSGLESEPA